MATIKDVAKKAGVGVGTVSRYLNNSKQISEEAKERIRIAIEETGYVRNELGRNLKTNNPRNIALLVPSIFHNFFSAIAFHIEQELAKIDYKIMICNSLNDLKKDIYYIDMLESGKISGIIGFSFTAIDEYIHEGLPFVIIDRNIKKLLTRVSSDNFYGGYQAAKKLHTSGCEKIGFVGTYSKKIDSDVKNRREGFLSYVKKHNVPYFEYIKEDPIKDYDEYIHRLVDEKLDDIDGIFVENDNLALSIIEYALSKNIKIPEQLSVIGYDGNAFHQLFHPKLTTLVQPIDKMAKAAVKELIEMIESPQNYQVKDLKFKPTLYIGETTK
jgi:LacI family transcriptional regulator